MGGDKAFSGAIEGKNPTKKRGMRTSHPKCATPVTEVDMGSDEEWVPRSEGGCPRTFEEGSKEGREKKFRGGKGGKPWGLTNLPITRGGGGGRGKLSEMSHQKKKTGWGKTKSRTEKKIEGMGVGSCSKKLETPGAGGESQVGKHLGERMGIL